MRCRQIDVAIQHGDHGARRAGTLPGSRRAVLKPSHDSRPVSESRSCVALRASRRAKRPRRRTVNSSKLGSSGRLKMMSAPAGPPRAISGTATSLQAICPPLVVLEFVGRDGLARLDRAAREFVADEVELLAGEREIGFGTAPHRARFLARENGGGGGASQAQANRAQHALRAAFGRSSRFERSRFLPTSPVLRGCSCWFRRPLRAAKSRRGP